ncbi:MAG: right-handed parallel beta-helix repeat-containing protein, partial [Kiritimatiellales bacterium]|nr:right-handed parallel beta-helix repeat-containing protein [Kiritimatiellales bacterium]
TKDYQTMQFPIGAIKQYANLPDVELRIVPSRYWTMNLLPIASIDKTNCTLTTTAPGTYPLGRNGMMDRDNAWIENALEVLDEPGEWVLDSARGRLYLWPRDGEPGNDIVVPALTELIRVEGDIDYDGPEDQPVTGLVFQGLTFRHGDRYRWHGRTGWGLQHDWECFDKPTALLRFRGAERCSVEDCEFTDSGHSAIRLDLHCQKIRITGNHIHGIGGVGILLAGYGPGTKNVNRNNDVSNNYIHHIGREYWGSAGIFAWQSGENRIAHNHIHHIPYTAIAATGRIVKAQPGPAECSRTIRWNETPETYLKWDWARREPYLHARKNRIEYNEIHNTMERLGDGNCIYVSGAGGGNEVRRNFCHDCTGDYMNAVIRCDDDQNDTLIEGNICCRTGGFGEGIISKGDNDIINNIIADLRPTGRHRGYIVFPYGAITGTTIARNIIYSGNPGQIICHHSQPTHRGEPPRFGDVKAENNLYFSTAETAWGKEHLNAQRKLGNERQSAIGDPLFADIGQDDFAFRPDSPAPAMGIKQLDSGRAGLEPLYRRRFVGRRLRTQITPSAHILRQPIRVSISCTDPSAQIRYTLDGSEPGPDAARYQTPFQLDRPAVVRATSLARNATDLTGAQVRYGAPPTPIVEDFEALPAGATVLGTETSEDPKFPQFTIRASTDQAADGNRSLKITDGPGQAKSFTPLITWHCQHLEGKMTGRFDVRMDAATGLRYQWRHYESGYREGPTIDFRPGGNVTHGGKTLLTIPLEQWVRFEVTCLLGDASDATFDLRVWLPGKDRPETFRGLSMSKKFQRLDWVSFIAQSKESSTCHVDNVEVREE